MVILNYRESMLRGMFHAPTHGEPLINSTISADTYKDYILTMLFSDIWQDHYEGYKAELAEREMAGYLQEPGYA